MKTAEMATQPIVSLHDAGVRFGMREALCGVSVSIARGEFVAGLVPTGPERPPCCAHCTACCR